jgi:hypothetical protein
MSVFLNIHGVARVEADAYSTPLVTLAGAPRMHCQTLSLWDADRHCLAQIVLFLDNPTLALPIGDRSRLDGVVLTAAAGRALADRSPF